MPMTEITAKIQSVSCIARILLEDDLSFDLNDLLLNSNREYMDVSLDKCSLKNHLLQK